jgi:hypothetical protein
MTRILLLLTIILASSCSDTINTDKNLLDNIVVMEDQIQRMNIIQLDRGDSYLMDIKSELVTTPRNDEMQMKSTKLTYILEQMDKIDKETNSIITLIEQCKFELLEKAGENLKEDVTKNSSSIVWRKHDFKKDGNSPSRLNLNAIIDKGNSEIATSYFIGSDNFSPSQKGMELWNSINNYRNSIVALTGSYSWRENKYSVTPININTYSSNQELLKQVSEMISNSNCNKNEDTWVLIDLYIGLTKPEKIKYNDETVHWISSTFNNSPLVNAIATLTSLEQDILSARALSLAHWKSKVSTCSYSFNKIMPLASGPSVSIEGEEIQIKVIMAAFDSDNQPVVKTTANNSTIKYDGWGGGIVSLKPKAGLNTYKGTVSIKNKAGVIKTENWEWTVKVLPE